MIFSESENILIAGAGPAGLVCALELTRLGVPFRIVEKRPKDAPPANRRGMVLRPCTLSMLEPLGLVDDLLKAGHKIQRFRIEEDERVLAAFSLSSIKSPYPFLLSISEDRLVSILTTKLCALGGRIEYDLPVTNARINPDGKIQVHFGDGSEGLFDRVIGADGVNSVVRSALGIPFTGYNYPGGWFFSDGPLATDEDTGVLALLPGGGMRLALPCGSGLTRRVSNAAFDGAETFPVCVRAAKDITRGGVRLLGGAGAAHGPFGGIGMSAAIEDALSLARNIAGSPEDALHDERRARLELAETIFRAARIRGRAGRFFRAYILFLCARVPSFRRRVLHHLTGFR